MENKEYEIMAELELNHWWYNNLHNLIKETLQKEAIKLKRSLSIFDIGCGTGGLIYRLKNKSYVSKILASDPHPLARKFAKKRGINLECVNVQMKLSVVKEEISKEIVPKISEFANSQNKVSSADFFSNHPFHVVIEDFSRRIIAPPKKGSTLQTKWFYERARGQYAEARSQSSTPSERKKFDTINPRSQLVTKTDLAIVMNTFRGFPNIVSKGAQKSFTNFSNEIKKSWKEDEEKNVKFNEQFFKSSMCRVRIFRALEKLVSQQEW